MNIDDLEKIPEDMLNLGLGALTHANRLAAYQDMVNDKWAELSVIQAAHAAEILIKARIAEEHPLLIFESFPKDTSAEMTLNDLFENGHTVEWAQLPNRLWAITKIHIQDVEAFKAFGKLRNGIQHFGAVPPDISASLKTLEFIYSVIDPFINECWEKYAIDYDEDDDSYEHFLPTLIGYEIKFLVSPSAAKDRELWEDCLNESSPKYREEMKKRIENALTKSP